MSPTRARRIATRLPLALGAVAALAIGVAGGLARLGIAIPVAAPLAAEHGVLMACGFFGAVIGLERAIALGAGWALLAPAGAAAGTLALLGQWRGAAGVAFMIGAAALLAVSGAIVRRQQALHTVTLAIAAGAWLAGIVAWIAAGAAVAVPLWFTFLVLTIAGERLELTRVLPPAPRARTVFIAIVAGVLASAALATVGATGSPFGIALFALAAWLARCDIARRTVRQHGLTRYIAVCLLAGYAWLAVGGLLAAAGALTPGAPGRDAAVHALGLGFIVSMVFGHAPVIVPALTGLRVAWSGAFYAPLLLLHGSLALRALGSAAGAPGWLQAGGIGNAVAIALFAATLLAGVVRAAQAVTPTSPLRTGP